ncbi:MAG TPA: hypothetical protein VEA44_03945 [Caulobacter sp.]|nr:hypothetical protein [Caulobacter sp.]
MGRILLAGLLGGLAMFIWSSLAHTVLPLGHIGINQLPGGSAAPAALQADAGQQAGLYMFPGVGAGLNPHEDEESRKQMMEAVKTSPSGIVIYHPPGRSTDMAPFLISEALIEIVQGLLLAFVLAKIAAVFGTRLLAATAIGAAAAITTNGSNAIWYGFPMDFSIATAVTTFIGYVVAGAVAAWLLGRKAKVADAG